jgi:hypothetical protein
VTLVQGRHPVAPLGVSASTATSSPQSVEHPTWRSRRPERRVPRRCQSLSPMGRLTRVGSPEQGDGRVEHARVASAHDDQDVAEPGALRVRAGGHERVVPGRARRVRPRLAGNLDAATSGNVRPACPAARCGAGGGDLDGDAGGEPGLPPRSDRTGERPLRSCRRDDRDARLVPQWADGSLESLATRSPGDATTGARTSPRSVAGRR